MPPPPLTLAAPPSTSTDDVSTSTPPYLLLAAICVQHRGRCHHGHATAAFDALTRRIDSTPPCLHDSTSRRHHSLCRSMITAVCERHFCRADAQSRLPRPPQMMTANKPSASVNVHLWISARCVVIPRWENLLFLVLRKDSLMILGLGRIVGTRDFIT